MVPYASCGQPTALPDTEMEIMRSGLSQSLRAEPHPFLTVGRRVQITRGPFAGLEGILKQQAVSLDQNFWVMRLSGGELCLDQLPSAEALAHAVNGQFVLEQSLPRVLPERCPFYYFNVFRHKNYS